MKLWDLLFEKKVTIKGHDENGKSFERHVSEKQFNEWERNGLIITQEIIEVQVLDPNGNYTVNWKVGEDISADVVDKYKNPITNKLYAFTVYEDGNPKTSVLPHAMWLELKTDVGE